MDCDECTTTLAELLQEPFPRRLLQAIEQRGKSAGDSRSEAHGLSRKEDGDGHGRTHFECRMCPKTGPVSGARGFVEAPPTTVVLCANRLASRPEVAEVLVHELTHVYDYEIAGRDLRDCKTLAYSEIRAARAAECSTLRWPFTHDYFEKRCARGKAKQSTEVMFPQRGARCVDAVFDVAYQDRTPHDDPCEVDETIPR